MTTPRNATYHDHDKCENCKAETNLDETLLLKAGKIVGCEECFKWEPLSMYESENRKENPTDYRHDVDAAFKHDIGSLSPQAELARQMREGTAKFVGPDDAAKRMDIDRGLGYTPPLTKTVHRETVAPLASVRESVTSDGDEPSSKPSKPSKSKPKPIAPINPGWPGKYRK